MITCDHAEVDIRSEPEAFGQLQMCEGPVVRCSPHRASRAEGSQRTSSAVALLCQLATKYI